MAAQEFDRADHRWSDMSGDMYCCRVARAEGTAMDSQRDFETVFAGTSIETGLAKGFLHEHGVTAYLADEHLGTAPQLAAGGGVGAVKVQWHKRRPDEYSFSVEHGRFASLPLLHFLL